jgi:hypothetical protein
MKPTSDELLKKVDEFLESEGTVSDSNMTTAELLEEYILPAMKQSKSTLGSIYDYQPRNKSGFIGNLRNKAINKIKNVVVSTMEKPMIKQQKYNELLFKAVEALIEENKKLRSEK